VGGNGLSVIAGSSSVRSARCGGCGSSGDVNEDRCEWWGYRRCTRLSVQRLRERQPDGSSIKTWWSTRSTCEFAARFDPHGTEALVVRVDLLSGTWTAMRGLRNRIAHGSLAANADVLRLIVYNEVLRVRDTIGRRRKSCGSASALPRTTWPDARPALPGSPFAATSSASLVPDLQ
jgi:hypothetical protein